MNDLAEFILVLNRGTQRHHQRCLPLAVSQIGYRAVFEEQGNDFRKSRPRRAVQRGLSLVIARIYVCPPCDQISDAVSIAAAVAARLENDRRPAIFSSIRIAIHSVARQQFNLFLQDLSLQNSSTIDVTQYISAVHEPHLQ